MYTPRRPAQLNPEQIELIPGDQDTAYSSELAHTTAQVVVPVENSYAEEDPDARQRIRDIITEEGIDVLAESWVNSPEDSLPGILWRGYLLREWIRRYPDVVQDRFSAASVAVGDDAGGSPSESADDAAGSPSGSADDAGGSPVSSPHDVRAMWDEVLEGDYQGDFTRVLRTSANFTRFIGSVEPSWIGEDEHPLATEVTRRQTAMLATADEFDNAATLNEKKALH